VFKKCVCYDERIQLYTGELGVIKCSIALLLKREDRCNSGAVPQL